MADVKISYTQTRAEQEVFPDNPDFKWVDEYAPYKDMEVLDGWFKYLVDRFEKFEHNRRSCIFRSYGHDYEIPDQRYISMPDGNTPSGNMSPMKTDLRAALDYRLNNFNDEDVNGWKVFESLTGWYDVDVVDGAVVEERKGTLTRFIELLGGDEYLSRYDPQTKKIAITPVDEDGNMKPIEYMFPMGPEDTDSLHYVVLEPEKNESKIEKDEDIAMVVKRGILELISRTEAPVNEKRGLGTVMSKYSKQLRPHIEVVRKYIHEYVEKYNSLITVEGIDSINAELEALPFQQLDDEPGEGPLVETYKKIDIGNIIKKVKDKVLKTRLERIRPPSKGKAGGSSWPVAKGGEYSLWITTDPFELLTKTTGRAWGERTDSCENYDGCANQGPVSDVHYGNAIVWVYRRDNTEYRNELGRFSLRWGESFKGGNKLGVDVGVEIQVYPKNDAPWGFNILGAIGMILKDKGFLNYDYCKTPYTYLGYSDKAGNQKVPIQYDAKIFLKGRGEVVVGDANALVETANNEKLSYADAGYVITYGNTQALLALAQNQMIWIYETPLRRLVNKSMDIEQGPLLIRFLVESDVANFDFLEGLVNNLELFDDNYGDATDRNSLVQAMLRHFKCNKDTHYAIRESYEGYFWEDTLIGGVDELDYFALLDNNSRLASHYNTPPIITSAPIELLDILSEKLISGKLEGDKDKRLELWWRFAPDEERLFRDSSQSSKNMYSKHRDFLVGLRHLIFCPNLSLLSYGKLLTHYNKLFQSSRAKKLWAKFDVGETCIFSRTLKTVKDAIIASLIPPLNSPDSWGYTEWLASGENQLYLGLESIPENLRYRVSERQSAKTVKIVAALDSTPLNMLNIMKNIRNRGAFKYLWDNRKKYNIGAEVFTYNIVNSKNMNETINNYMLTPEMLIEAVIELGKNNEIQKFAYVDNNHVEKRVDYLDEQVVNYILKHPQWCERIGFELVALWLTTGPQFNVYQKIIYEYAVGGYYIYQKEKGKKGTYRAHFFKPPPPIDLMNVDQYREYSAYTSGLSVLELAACGGNFEEGGLAANPNVPEDIQLKMILPSETPMYGNNKWRSLSRLYGGDYEEYIRKTYAKLCLNPNVCANALKYIMNNAPDLEYLIASNSAISANEEFIEGVMVEDPIPLLKNPNLGHKNLILVKDYFMEYLNKAPPTELERFTKGYTKGRWNYVVDSLRRDWSPNFSDSWSPLLTKIKKVLDKTDYVAFWRGGNYKKKMGLENSRNIAPIGSKGRPMAIVDEPILIERPQVILDINLSQFGLEEVEIGKTYTCLKCGNRYSSPEEMMNHWRSSAEFDGDLEDYDHQSLVELDDSSEGWKEKPIMENRIIEGEDYWRVEPSSRMRFIEDIIYDGEKYVVTGHETSPNKGKRKAFTQNYDSIDEIYGYNKNERKIDMEKIDPKMIVSQEVKDLLGKTWDYDVTLVMFDVVAPEDIIVLPKWRMELNQESLNAAFSSLIGNLLFKDEDIYKLTEDLLQKSLNIKTNADINLNYNYINLFKQIDIQDRWDISLINENLVTIFGGEEVYRSLALENLKPTGELLELSLSQDERLIRQKLGIRLGRLKNIQDWILSNYGAVVPIRYIYMMIDNPLADAYIIDKAKVLRSQRINEFLEYAAAQNPDALGAEEGSYARPPIDLRVLQAPPKINNILIEYVESVHPANESKQNELMNAITSGQNSIGLDRMIEIVKQHRKE